MPRWEPNARMRLVESALELFEDQGYDKTGVIQIAQGAGLTKTTFFRHFPDKREVLFAGQDDHNELLAQAIADAPTEATPLQQVRLALEALAATQPAERHGFCVRLRTVVGAHSDLQEREALKYEGYRAAIDGALQERSVAALTATVAADLGILAFRTAFARWTDDASPPPLRDMVVATLDDLHAASAALR